MRTLIERKAGRKADWKADIPIQGVAEVGRRHRPNVVAVAVVVEAPRIAWPEARGGRFKEARAPEGARLHLVVAAWSIKKKSVEGLTPIVESLANIERSSGWKAWNT